MILDNPLNPKDSLQLNNKYWPSDSFHNLNLISDLEESLSKKGYLGSLKLLKKTANLLPKSARKSFLFLIARERLFKTDFGISFYKNIFLKSLDERTDITLGTHDYIPKKSEELEHLEKSIIKKYRNCFGLDITQMHRQIRFAVPDNKTEDIRKFGGLSDYHNDEAKGLTTMVYLTDVLDPDYGAFQYIENSHSIPRSDVLTAAHIAVGFSLKINTPNQMEGLPLEFRGNPGIGNFLDNSKCELLKPFVKDVLGNKGTAWTFNGHLLLHRGGKVTKGFRKAYFIQPEGKFFFKIKTFLKAYSLSLIASR